MIPFQFVGIFVCLLLAGWSVRRYLQGQRPRSLSLLGIAVGLLGAVTIFDPEITTRIARALGIARGADLLIYLVALAFLVSWFYFYQRIRSLSAAVTMLARELAIRNPRVPPDGPTASPVTPATETQSRDARPASSAPDEAEPS
jgi:small membrane protein